MQPLDGKRPEGLPDVLNDFIALGRVSGLFGVKGWVKVFSDTQPRENITQYGNWWLNNTESTKDWQRDWQKYKILQARPHGKTIIALFDGITTREAAAKLIGQQVAIPRNLLPEAQEDEYYWADLVGCKVVSVSGEEMGLVDRLFETGANDVLVVKKGKDIINGSDNSEVLIPWVVPDVITNIDITAKQIVVDWDPDY
ncbi:MAG: ribosome maturation factor RimM [Granulosicoccaceae bacterium]